MQNSANKFWARPARLAYACSILALTASLAACGGGTPSADGGAVGAEGDIQIDGSSTVYPISEAMAEEFQIANPNARVTVAFSGSGGGFKKFCAGEIDISNASRQIKDSEIEQCNAAGIEFIEVPIAYDGITLVVNPENDWAQCVTLEQLNAAWAPEAENTIDNWNQLDPSFPDQTLVLYGPGADSGTFDYFTDEVNGEEGASRGDYAASENDNSTVTGVEGAIGGMGYFGYAYYEENQGALKSLAVENEAGECIIPSAETIADGTYNPMSRPLFFYVNAEAYESKPQVAAFVDYQLDPSNGGLVQEVGYITLPNEDLAQSKARIDERKVGKDPS